MESGDLHKTYIVDNLNTNDDAVKRFDLLLTLDECNLVFGTHQKVHEMRSGWMDVIAHKFNKVWPYCTLAFKYHHFSQNFSRKKRSPFWIVKARCRTNLCVKVDMRINDEPPGLKQFLEFR